MKRMIFFLCYIFIYSIITASEGVRGTVQVNFENSKSLYFPVLFSAWRNYYPDSPARNEHNSWYMGKEMFGIESIAGIGLIYYTKSWEINLVTSLEYKCDQLNNQRIINIDSEFLTGLSREFILRLGTGFQNKFYSSFYESSERKSQGQHTISYGVVNHSKIVFGWKPVPGGEFYMGEMIYVAYAADKKETYVYDESGEPIDYVGEVGFIKTGFYKNRVLAGYSGNLDKSTISFEAVYDYIPDKFEGAHHSIMFELKFIQQFAFDKAD